MTVDSYLLDITSIEVEKLFASWLWLLDDEAEIEPWLMNCFGDLFFLDEDGTVIWLNVTDGELTEVAGSPDEFTQMLENDEHFSEWFLPGLVDDLQEAGNTLQPGQCFAFRQLPVLGGDYELPNITSCSVQSYWDFCGVIHAQIDGLPDGEEVDIDVPELGA